MVKNFLPSHLLEDGVDPSSLLTHHFIIHGLAVRVRSNSAYILGSISELLSFFTANQSSTAPEVDFRLLQCPTERLSLVERIRKGGSIVFDSETDDELEIAKDAGIPFKYILWENLYMADFGAHGAVVVDIKNSLASGCFPDPTSIHPVIFSNFMFIIAFSEMLRSKDYFLIHAAALEEDGKGIIIPACTGSGKTTLALALVSGGFNFLSDDRPILTRKDNGVQMLAFPEGVDVTDETISFFPELSSLAPRSFAVGLRKKKFWIENLYAKSIVRNCAPRLLLFPRITRGDKSWLEPLTKTEAIQEILPHSLLVLDREVTSRHFDVLCETVESTDCYRIHFGLDFPNVHRLVREIL